MPTVGVRLALTLNVGEREFFRPEVSIEDLDASLPLEPQIKVAVEGLEKAFEASSELLLKKVSEYLSQKGG